MNEFRSHIILEIHKQGLRKLNLTELYPRCSIVSLTLVKGAAVDMETPCWVTVVYLGALRMLRDNSGKGCICYF